MSNTDAYECQCFNCCHRYAMEIGMEPNEGSTIPICFK